MVQVLAFGRVQDNRVARRERKSALKAERERVRKLEVECVGEERKSVKIVAMGGLDGADSTDEGAGLVFLNGNTNGGTNGAAKKPCDEKTTQPEGADETESEASLTETSEEEMMI